MAKTITEYVNEKTFYREKKNNVIQRASSEMIQQLLTSFTQIDEKKCMSLNISLSVYNMFYGPEVKSCH